ncbi:NUDIX hydrolase [Marinovum sp.]|uniref:NUDIX hydrolase n=1 Tax=Marinovum sp. TaxID=2024839 RepID=UPI002B26524B|nr:NUDIX hydrolase [Marinovum sp.]
MTSDKTLGRGPLHRLRRLILRGFRQLALPMLQRPRQVQTAALCYRKAETGVQVLLITSRGTGRWIIPKGWLMRGKNAGEAAATEAWEEAGVQGAPPATTPIGSYIYDKITNSGLPVTVETLVFPIEVRSLAQDYPEVSERDRRWLDPAEAAGMVAEPGLQQILREFAGTLRETSGG